MCNSPELTYVTKEPLSSGLIVRSNVDSLSSNHKFKSFFHDTGKKERIYVTKDKL